MSYKIKNLVLKDRFDFNSINPEKQKEVSEQTGLAFSLQDIVDFIQKNSNNFSKDNDLLLQLDDAVMTIYERYVEKEKKEKEIEEIETPEEKKGKSKYSEEDLKIWQDAIDGLVDSINKKEYTDENMLQEWQDAIEGLQELIDEKV